MSFKIKTKPRIELTLKQFHIFNGKSYDQGHKFHVIGMDSIRGYDIEDKDGNKIYEIRMVMHLFDINKT